MMRDLWYFKNEQAGEKILQPDFFRPRSHIGIAFADSIQLPCRIDLCCRKSDTEIYRQNFEIQKECTETYSVIYGRGLYVVKISAELDGMPDSIEVRYQDGENDRVWKKNCTYSVLSGIVTDFYGQPFPAAVCLYRYWFDKDKLLMGIWTDKQGRYSVIVPDGRYNALYCDDESYGRTSLECWGWNIVVDRDETLDLRIGNGEVYSLNTMCSNGGADNLFIAFRPMSIMKRREERQQVNDRAFTVWQTVPDLQAADITVCLDGKQTSVISLQRLLETDESGIALPMYIAQVRRPSSRGKQKLTIEFSVRGDDGNTYAGMAFAHIDGVGK